MNHASNGTVLINISISTDEEIFVSSFKEFNFGLKKLQGISMSEYIIK
ncbi:hypothetical protein [Leptotrichia sp. OH3620_COT-345]|nr:hypothetical protein [Leptotrichia sp. OH3620_COT-345]